MTGKRFNIFLILHMHQQRTVRATLIVVSEQKWKPWIRFWNLNSFYHRPLQVWLCAAVKCVPNECCIPRAWFVKIIYHSFVWYKDWQWLKIGYLQNIFCAKSRGWQNRSIILLNFKTRHERKKRKFWFYVNIILFTSEGSNIILGLSHLCHLGNPQLHILPSNITNQVWSLSTDSC